MSRRKLPVLIILTLSLILIASTAIAKSPNAEKNTPVYYLSLGTSLAAGVQADPVTGEDVVTDVSYPSILASILAETLSGTIKKLRHVNLGCPGENSDTFIEGGICDYPRGSQLDEAVNFLHAHGKFTGLITIDLGANDALACFDGPYIDDKCFKKTVKRLSRNLAYVIKTLRKVAGPNVPIVGMDYYNPLLVFWFEDPPLAMQTANIQNQLNNALLKVYARFGIPVADVSEAFESNNFTDSNGSGVPDNVELICAWTWMCEWFNIHPNASGYSAIANEFVIVLPSIPISKPSRRR
ncbi:MAG: SGNH/GDSL hydrolase family protein [Desulfobacterales bacterium]